MKLIMIGDDSEPLVFMRHLHHLRFGLHLQFLVNAGNVIANGVGADIQCRSYAFGIPPTDNMLSNFCFPLNSQFVLRSPGLFRELPVLFLQ